MSESSDTVSASVSTKSANVGSGLTLAWPTTTTTPGRLTFIDGATVVASKVESFLTAHPLISAAFYTGNTRPYPILFVSIATTAEELAITTNEEKVRMLMPVVNLANSRLSLLGSSKILQEHVIVIKEEDAAGGKECVEERYKTTMEKMYEATQKDNVFAKMKLQHGIKKRNVKGKNGGLVEAAKHTLGSGSLDQQND